MLYKCKFKYSAGGYPSPTYSGESEVGFNAHENADDLEEKAEYRAKIKVKDKTMFPFSMIKIKIISINEDN